MPAEVATIVTVLGSVFGAVWFLSWKMSSLTSSDGNMKADIAQLTVDVGMLKTDMASVKTILQPERISATPHPRKRPRR